MTIQIARPLPRKSVLSVAIAGLLLGPGVQAATLTVDSLTDDGAGCTLREAIESINAGSNQGGCTADVTEDYGTNDTILFHASVTGTITLNGTELGITQSMSIQGPGAAGLAVDGAGTSRVFNISGAGVAVSIDRLTIQGGLVNGSFPANAGGGILVQDTASLALSNSTVSGNSAGFGGGIGSYNSQLNLIESTLSGNSVYGGGGGIDAFNSPVTLTNTTVSGNAASYFGGGIEANSYSAVILTNTTISDNRARRGGGIDIGSNSSLAVTNGTVSGNSTGQNGGGIFASGNSSLTLNNSSISDNSANAGGGIYVINSSAALTNTLLAGNSTDCFKLGSSTVTGTFNLIGDAASACDLTDGNDGNIVGVADPLIAPLADNGCMTPAGNPNGPPEFYGCVQTHALLPGSPALDAATASGAPATDQRGVARPQGAGVDIGAFELEREPDPAPIPALPLWGLLGGAGLLGLLGVWRGRRVQRGRRLPHGQRH